jgi:hypothetical protein
MGFQFNRFIIIIIIIIIIILISIIIIVVVVAVVVVVESVGLRVPNRNLRDFISFNVDLKRHDCPSCRRPSTANFISRDVGIFNGKSVFTN